MKAVVVVGGWGVGVWGGADGVTECLGTCHIVSALASTSGRHSLSPQAQRAQLAGLDRRGK